MAIAAQYDFDPLRDYPSTWSNTVSVGIYQWIYTKDGKQLKRSKCVYRVKGPSNMSTAINERARQICDELNAGKNSVIGKKKSETIK